MQETIDLELMQGGNEGIATDATASSVESTGSNMDEQNISPSSSIDTNHLDEEPGSKESSKGQSEGDIPVANVNNMGDLNEVEEKNDPTNNEHLDRSKSVAADDKPDEGESIENDPNRDETNTSGTPEVTADPHKPDDDDILTTDVASETQTIEDCSNVDNELNQPIKTEAPKPDDSTKRSNPIFDPKRDQTNAKDVIQTPQSDATPTDQTDVANNIDPRPRQTTASQVDNTVNPAEIAERASSKITANLEDKGHDIADKKEGTAVLSDIGEGVKKFFVAVTPFNGCASGRSCVVCYEHYLSKIGSYGVGAWKAGLVPTDVVLHNVVH